MANAKNNQIPSVEKLLEILTPINEHVYLPVITKDVTYVQTNVNEMRQIADTFYTLGKNLRRDFDNFAEENVDGYERIVAKVGRPAGEKQAKEITADDAMKKLLGK